MMRNVAISMLLLGTGTSSQVPSIACLTAPQGQGCACCISTLRPEGRKNIRRNTSALVRFQDPGDPKRQKPRAILIDVGKSFAEAAREHFPKNGVRELDAVLLTHPHADAVNGLDDLRAWTLGGAIQDTIDVYCNEYTYTEIARMFPYMVSEGARTGGGDVPAFLWHVIENGKHFDLFGVRVTPLPVHHGAFFGENPRPYISLAFLFNASLCYMADVSGIPDTTWELLEQAINGHRSSQTDSTASIAGYFVAQGGDDTLSQSSLKSSRGALSSADAELPILVIDCLRIAMHFSHFGIAQAVAAAKRMKARRTYILGFSHRVSHQSWVSCCEAISAGRVPSTLPARDYVPQATGATTPSNRQSLACDTQEDGEHLTQQALTEVWALQGARGGGCWIRPAYDGLQLKTDGIEVADDCY